MKKKALMAVLPICVTMAMTACGGNADATGVEETAVTEENAEADALAEVEAEASTADEEPVESEQTGEEPVDGNVEGDDSADDSDTFDVSNMKFMELYGEAIEQDKSADYGINSTSSDDLLQFIGEDGTVEWEYEFEGKEHSEFSGRFAYPTLVQGDVFPMALIERRTDVDESVCVYEDGERAFSITFLVGTNSWNFTKDQIEYAGSMGSNTYDIPYSIDTVDGTEEVIHERFVFETYPAEGDFNEDGVYVGTDGEVIEPVESDPIHVYLYKLGAFTVDVNAGLKEISQEEMQAIADNIVLVGNLAE